MANDHFLPDPLYQCLVCCYHSLKIKEAGYGYLKKTIGVTSDCYRGLRERLFNRALMLSISTSFPTNFGGTIMSISTANDLMDARGVYLILKAQAGTCNR